MNRDEISNKLLRIAEPVCLDAGYELVDLLFRREPSGWVVRVFIDHAIEAPGAGGISFADCERISRELSAVFDVEDPIEQAYSLEVSSPGVDRPLRTASHFRRHVGQEASVQLAPDSATSEALGGRRKFRGTILDVREEEVRVSEDASAGQGAGERVVAPESSLSQAAVATVPGTDLPGVAPSAVGLPAVRLPAVRLEVDGKEHDLPIADMVSARLIPDWAALLGGGSRERARSSASEAPAAGRGGSRRPGSRRTGGGTRRNSGQSE
jgi:ribosome maturation factor RimP